MIHSPDYLQVYTKEIIEYLENKRETFTSPIAAYGTAFQLSVWSTVREIPYGKHILIQKLQIEFKNLQRYVPLRRYCCQPTLIMIPCHRVIGKNGKLTGFRGGLEMKKELLALEKLQVEFI